MTTSKEVTVCRRDRGLRGALPPARSFTVLIDRDEPASGYSFGNAGLIQCASVVPDRGGIVRQVPRMTTFGQSASRYFCPSVTILMPARGHWPASCPVERLTAR